jgi:hypothetical protein
MRHLPRFSQIVWGALCLIGLLGWNIAFAQDANPAQADRVLAILTVPPLEPAPPSDKLVELYLEAIKTTADAGVTGNVNTQVWSKLEPSPGQFALDDLAGDLNYRVTTYNQILMVGLQVLNTNTKETPADLLNTAFDSPDMLKRFHALIDALLPHLSHNVFYLSVGNEVDAYLSAHPEEWKSYTAFYTDAVDYLHRAASWIKVGVTVTYNGAIAHAQEVRALTEASDVDIMTYYPLEGDFMTRSPDASLADFPQEVGYPSSDLLGSSEEDQAAFIANIFAAWKKAGLQIPFLSIFTQGDLSDDLVKQFGQYYGLPQDQHFLEFLRTLGLRRVDGTPKLAWNIFVAEAARLMASNQTG